MRISAITHALPALLCAATLGCGGSPSPSSSGPGTMSVHLVDGPDSDYSEILLQVKKLEINGPSGWQTLADFTGTPDGVKTVYLLELTDGVYETLADARPLEPGHYDQMRMVLGAGNTVTPVGGSPEPLKVPSGMQSGVKFPVSFDIAPGTTRDVFIDFDAHRSIFVHQAGNSGKYMMRPVVRAFDKLLTGSISGTLTVAGTTPPAPIAGVDVMAEIVENGRPTIVRTVKTGADGKYTIDLVPIGSSYYVVTQPVVTTATPTPTTTVYPPAASGLLSVTAAAPTPSWNHEFTAATASTIGTVQGSIATAASADQTDTVYVLATFGGTQLAIRTKAASVTTSPPSETYQIGSLPFFDGGYALAVERATTTSGTSTLAWKTDPGAPFFASSATAQLETRTLNLFP